MRTRFLAVLLGGLFLAAGGQAQDLTLDQILDKNLEALGGAGALRAVQTMTMTAKMVMGGGTMEMPMIIRTKRPGKVRTEMTVQGQKIITGIDGTEGWMLNPMRGPEPQKMPEPMLKSAQRSGDMERSAGALKFMKEAGDVVELQGKEEVNGVAAYKIKLTRAGGDAQTYFIDAEKFLPVKIAMKTSQMGREMDVEVIPSDYKKVAGIMLAHTTDTKAGNSTMQMVIEKIEVNLPMDDAIFKMPAAEKQ